MNSKSFNKTLAVAYLQGQYTRKERKRAMAKVRRAMKCAGRRT